MDRLEPVTAHEWQTLLSLNRAYVDMRHAWEAACCLTDGLMTKMELTAGYVGDDQRYPHHLAALKEMLQPANTYEWQVGALTWRYASAAAVLGMAVMDRLAQQLPPLEPRLVEELARFEPSLGELKKACGAPYERLISVRDDDRYGTETKTRESLVNALSVAEYNLEHTDIGGRRLSAAEIDECQLSVVSQDGQEPFWQDLLKPVLDWAESVPYSIAFWLDRHSASG
ncbi:hypothetical protein [Streptomyces chrestomyceticus]|uniref:hypothetical protein n=1 Tax=Streptomyces chrestomyceticus TaxID=68185 RepID=UPI0037B9496A